jgi:hypothetical protein
MLAKERLLNTNFLRIVLLLDLDSTVEHPLFKTLITHSLSMALRSVC